MKTLYVLPRLLPGIALCIATLAPLGSGLSLQEAAPQDEPAPERGLRVHEAGAFEGYTLFSPLLSGSTYLVDMEGEVVHEWRTDVPPGNSVYLLDDGSLLRAVRVDDNPRFHGGGIGGRVQRLAWDGEVMWDFELSDAARCHHHDIEPLPNGNVLMITWELVTKEEARGLGRDEAVLEEEGWWPDAILEVEPQPPTGGRVVWEWHARDHLIQDRDPELAGYGSVPDHPERIDVNATHRDRPPMTEEERRREEEMNRRMRELGYAGGDEPDEGPPRRRGNAADWMHTNSVDYHAGLDLILLSSPRLNEIWIIDHSTTTEEAATERGGAFGKGGGVLWRWGNPRTYGAGEDSDQQLFAQHDAQWIPEGLPGAGNVLVFNNGLRRPGVEHSTIDELVLPLDPERGFVRARGAAFGPPRPTWTYAAPEPEDFYSFFISGCQRLPNGNTLVCSGAQGRLFEVTMAREIVWEYWNPYGGEIEPSFGKAAGGHPPKLEPRALFRATRIAPDHPGLRDRL